jgi:hypothetical protein
MESIGAGGFFYCAEYHVGRIKSDPVEHDTGNNFVNIAIGFKKTNNCAVKNSANACNNHAGKPTKSKGYCTINAYADTYAILTCSTDVEKTYFICKKDGKRAHKKRCGFYKGVTEVFDLKVCFGVMKEVFKNFSDSLTCAGGINEKKNNISDENTENNADK